VLDLVECVDRLVELDLDHHSSSDIVDLTEEGTRVLKTAAERRPEHSRSTSPR